MGGGEPFVEHVEDGEQLVQRVPASVLHLGDEPVVVADIEPREALDDQFLLRSELPVQGNLGPYVDLVAAWRIPRSTRFMTTFRALG
jgi:hypothetical protein